MTFSAGRFATVPDWQAKLVRENTTTKTTAICLVALFRKEENRLGVNVVSVLGVGVVMEIIIEQQQVNVLPA